MKILKDTLKNPGGSYSRKSLMLMVSFFVSIALGIFISISDVVFGVTANDNAVSIFDSLLLFTITLSGVTVADKKFVNKKGDE